MDTPTGRADTDPRPAALKSEKRRALAATLVAVLYVVFAIGAPLIVRYGPDTEPSLVTLSAFAPAQHGAAPRCASAPEFGLSCRAADPFLD